MVMNRLENDTRTADRKKNKAENDLVVNKKNIDIEKFEVEEQLQEENALVKKGSNKQSAEAKKI